MMRLRDIIRRHRIVLYFTLAFAISWFFILLAVGPEGLFDTETVYVAGPISLLGPSIAGILMMVLVYGKTGISILVSRLKRWNVGARWYAIALLTAPILITGILMALSAISPIFLPTLLNADEKSGLILSGIIAGIVVGTFEELGWTGFVMPEMRKRNTIFVTGGIMGILWGAWHLPLFLGSTSASGAIPSPIFITVLLFSFLVPYRILMVWVYDRTHSLLVVILMHMPLAASQFILIPSSISGGALVAYDLIFATILWIFVAFIFTTNRRKGGTRIHARQRIKVEDNTGIPN